MKDDQSRVDSVRDMHGKSLVATEQTDKASVGNNGTEPGTPEHVPAPNKEPSISAAKLAANRHNAGKSTGPKTAAGKRRASRNAIKHGFLSKFLLVQDPQGQEDEAEYNELYAGIHQHYQPVGALEELVLGRIVALYWRYRRLIRYETGLIALALAEQATSRPSLPELGIEDSSPEIDALRDHLFLPSKEESDKVLRHESKFTKHLSHATAELERLQSQEKAQDLQNEANKPFEMNAPECGCIQE